MKNLRLFWKLIFLMTCGYAETIAQSTSKKAPNVLLIVVDDLNTSLGCYGEKAVLSPNIDRLAARGVRFDRAYNQYPLCNPSRVSMLTGRRPETTGVYGLLVSARTAVPDAVMLPQYFRQKGYFTAGAGKVFHNPKTNDAASWDFYEDGDGEDNEEKTAIAARYGTKGDGRPSSFVLSSDGAKTRDGLNTQTILKLMNQQVSAKKPFFLAAGYHKPHLPWTAPKRFFDLYPTEKIKVPAEPSMSNIPQIALQTELSGFAQPDSRAEAIRGYYACISFTDYQVGLLLDELDKLDLWKNTVVVLVADNGFHLGDHNGLWAKLSAFDVSTRVPMIMAGAGVPKGKVITSPVELVDVYPTLVALAGGMADSALEGRNLAPYLGGKKLTSKPASSLVFHYDVANKRDVMGRTIINSQWRYTEWEGGKAGTELYMLANDPNEYQNKVADPAAQKFVQKGKTLLQQATVPKPGEANRPRALLPPVGKAN